MKDIRGEKIFLEKNERSCYILSMTKGDDTKAAILAVGLEMATQLGLECVTIGALATEMNLSKSGLFAHFQSKENMQLCILKYAAENFIERVLTPTLQIKPGIPRIKAIVENWIAWDSYFTGGCIFVNSGVEYSDRHGKVRDLLVRQQEDWLKYLQRIAESAIKSGDFRKDTDSSQFAFDLYSTLLGFHFYEKLLNDTQSTKRQKRALQNLFLKYIPPSLS